MCADRVRSGITAVALIAALATTVPQPAGALEGDRSKPIDIKADEAELRREESISIYRGDVRMVQGSIEITGDEVTIHHAQTERPLRAVVVGNPATYSQLREKGGKRVQAHAQRLEYSATDDTIELEGQAKVTQGSEQVTGGYIRWNIAEAHIIAESGGGSGAGDDGERVHIELAPDRGIGEGDTADSPGTEQP